MVLFLLFISLKAIRGSLGICSMHIMMPSPTADSPSPPPPPIPSLPSPSFLYPYAEMSVTSKLYTS